MVVPKGLDKLARQGLPPLKLATQPGTGPEPALRAAVIRNASSRIPY
ncbi:MAG: hypothetical protein ABIN37_01285 [Burkholderiaceae bacterium]